MSGGAGIDTLQASALGYAYVMTWDHLDPRPRDPTVAKGLALMGAAVRRRRESIGVSQRELSRRSGVSQSAISRFERGRQFCIRWSRFARIVVVLGGLDFDLSRAHEDRQSAAFSSFREHARGQELAALRMIEARQLNEARQQAATTPPDPQSSPSP